MAQTDLSTIITDFTVRLVTAVEQATTRRIQTALLAGIGRPVRRGPGRPRKDDLSFGFAAEKPRTRRPKQLCPVPGCKNPAAPVFGMVCAKHKDVPKSKIKKYREARRKRR